MSYAGTDTLPPFDIKDHEIGEIPLPQQTIDLLLRLQAEGAEKVPYVLLTEARYHRVVKKWQTFQAMGRIWRNRDYANNVLLRFKQRVQRAGIKMGGKTLSVHSLRKATCQNWIQDGLPINVVKKLMGHSDMGTTEKFYSQFTKEQRAQVAAASTARLQLPADATDLKLTFSPDFACRGATESR